MASPERSFVRSVSISAFTAWNSSAKCSSLAMGVTELVSGDPAKQESGGLLLLRRSALLARRNAVHFCSGAYTPRTPGAAHWRHTGGPLSSSLYTCHLPLSAALAAWVPPPALLTCQVVVLAPYNLDSHTDLFQPFDEVAHAPIARSPTATPEGSV